MRELRRCPNVMVKKPKAKKDPILEYIDSRRMIQRVKIGEFLSVRILGNYGIYKTRTFACLLIRS